MTDHLVRFIGTGPDGIGGEVWDTWDQTFGGTLATPTG